MDFNTQRKAVAAVESFGRKYKILYPLCMLAVLCIALFCSAVRAVDMALSDDDGRFLGMNRTRNRRRKASESKARVSAPAEKRGFLRRAVSGILSLCFAVMVVPAGLEIVSFAASSVATADQLNIENGVLKGFSDKVKNDSDFNYANTLDIVNGEGDVSFSSVAPSAFYGNTVISSIDLTGVKSIGLDAFKNATSLTRVIIDGRDVTFSDSVNYFDYSSSSKNDPFLGIAKDSIIYVNNVQNSQNMNDLIGTLLRNNGHNVEYNSSTNPENYKPDDVAKVETLDMVSGAEYALVKITTTKQVPIYNDKYAIQLYIYNTKNYSYDKIDYHDLTKVDEKTYVASISNQYITPNSNYGLIAARIYNETTYEGIDYIYSTHFTCSSDTSNVLSTSSPGFGFYLTGLNPTAYWNDTYTQDSSGNNVDYYIFYPSTSSLSGYDVIYTGYTDVGGRYETNLKTITSSTGYPAYLLEVYEPISGEYQQSDFSALLETETGKPDNQRNQWNNYELYYYRLSEIQVAPERLPAVAEKDITVVRNPECDDKITFTWKKVVGKDTLEADGYKFYFDSYETIDIDLRDPNNIDPAVSIDDVNGTVSYTYTLPEGVTSGKHVFNIYAYKYYEDENIKAPGYGDDKDHEIDIQIQRYSLTTESTKEGEIILKWKYTDDGSGYVTNENNFIISYYINDNESTKQSINVDSISPDTETGEYIYKISDYIDISESNKYTFTVSQNCSSTDNHEHFFSSNKALAQTNTEPLAPTVEIVNGNREFTVVASSEDGNVAGFHIRVYAKNGEQKGSLLHESYITAANGQAEERILQFNQTPNNAAPENQTEYIVEVNSYSHSQHENSNKYSGLPDEYNVSGYKPYPIEHEYNDPVDETYYTTNVAMPTNSIVLKVTWNNAEKPSGRGALLSWSTVSEKAQYYKITRRTIDINTNEVLDETVIEAQYPAKGSGNINTYVDSTAPFAVYTPTPDDPNGDVDYYNLFEYEVVAVYADGTVDPLPAMYRFQFKESDASLSAPNDVKAVGSDGQITVSWLSVYAADRYNIYREDENGDMQLLATVESDGADGKTLYYVDHPMDNDINRNYAVSAVYSVANNDSNDPNLRKLVESPLVSANGTSGERFTPVTGLTGTTTDGTITVKWDKHPDAEYYTLYATRVDDNGNPVGDPIKYIVNGTTYTIDNLDNGDLYTFEVYANKTVNNKEVTSEQGSTISVVVGMPIYPPNVSATPGNKKVTLTWTPNPQSKTTDGYYISRYDPETGEYTLLASTVGTTYTDINLVNGKTYWYSVQSYKSVSWHTIVSDYSLPVQATPDSIYAEDGEKDPRYLDSPADFTVTASDGTATLSWTAVSGADGYRIYMIDKNGVPILLGTTTKTTIDYTGLINGEVYTYTVTAYKTLADGELVESAFATPRSVTIGSYLAAPVDVTATAGDGKVTLSWTAVTGATGYVVYAYNAAKNSFTAIGVVSKPGFVHEGLENGLTYSYMIVAYRTVGLSNQYSQYSLAVSATPHGSSSDSTGDSGNGSDSGSLSGGTNNGGYYIDIVGTVPEGISHTELISAYSDELAFKQDIDIRFSVNTDSSKAIYDVLSKYADGLDSFDVYPFDISAYIAGTTTKVQPATGHYVTVTMPVPDSFRKYENDFQLIHINSDGQMEVLALTYGESDQIPLVQFSVSEFSPFAFVHFYTPEDLASMSGAAAAGAANTAAAGSVYALRFTGSRGYTLRKRNRIYKLIKK